MHVPAVKNCDNCGVNSLPDSSTNLPDERDAANGILLSVFIQQGWGKCTLTRLLRGEDAGGDRARSFNRIRCAASLSQ